MLRRASVPEPESICRGRVFGFFRGQIRLTEPFSGYAAVAGSSVMPHSPAAVLRCSDDSCFGLHQQRNASEDESVSFDRYLIWFPRPSPTGRGRCLCRTLLARIRSRTSERRAPERPNKPESSAAPGCQGLGARGDQIRVTKRPGAASTPFSSIRLYVPAALPVPGRANVPT